jgi:hypothetical protein
MAAVLELATIGIPVRITRTAGEREASTSDDPGEMARDRSVVVSVERLAPLGPEQPQEALPGPPTPESPVQPNQQLVVELESEKWSFPTPYVIVNVEVKGTFTSIVGDPKSSPGDWTIKHTLTLTPPPRVSGTSLERQLNEDWKASVKVSIDAKGTPSIQLRGTRRIPLNFSVGGVPLNLSAGGGVGTSGPFVAFAGESPHTVVVAGVPVTGKLKLEGTAAFLPTPALVELLARLGIYVRTAAAATGEAAAEAAIAAARATRGAIAALAARAAAVAAPVGYALAGAAGAVLFAGAYQQMLDEQVRQATDRSFQITARLAYTTVIARAVLGEAADVDFRAAVDQLEEIGRSRPDAMQHAERAVALALTDLLNLGGQLDATLQALKDRFPDTKFTQLRERMYVALGGLEDVPIPIGLPALLAVEPTSTPDPTNGSTP